MRDVEPLSQEFFDNLKEKPVKVQAYNPKSAIIADEYIALLKNLLSSYSNIQFLHRGSTALEIAGKGDVEIGICPEEKDWESIFDILHKRFGEPHLKEPDFILFNDRKDAFEIELAMMKGFVAVREKALLTYLKGHKALCKQYEDLKYKYAYSKKQYAIEKEKFLREVVKQIQITTDSSSDNARQMRQ